MQNFGSMLPCDAPDHHCDRLVADLVPCFQLAACDNIILVYFGDQDLNSTGEQAFKRQLWQCMVGQALLIKQNIETRRSNNQFGVIVWQFNEIWPTGGWGSIE